MFEEIYPVSSNIESTGCIYQEQGQTCNKKSHKIISLVAVHPDNMWSGVQTDFGYFTSKKQYEDVMRDKKIVRATPDVVSEVQRKSERRKVEAEQRRDKIAHDLAVEALQGVEVSPDNAHIVGDKIAQYQSRTE